MNKADKNAGILRFLNTSTPCVFISHKKEDQQIAVALGDFLMNDMHVDIYLDIYDPVLQEAVSVENDEKIVQSIRTGLKESSMLLCIVSDKTKLSWWVPYEIGIADHAGLKIASIRTKSINDFPSFLKTKTTLNSLSDLIEYILKNGELGSVLYSERKKAEIRANAKGKVNEFFN